ncbi:MAG: hypothetical protein LBS88_11700 [Tannerellaceae bacterium]|jgi:hypothetical protein|nr:hypothetical protein [Tannerellaceae bacterium]
MDDSEKKFKAICKLFGYKGTDKDEIPEGIGKFGYEVTNPIPVHTITGSQFYLKSLRTPDGGRITYKRLYSTQKENIEAPIDAYQIFSGGEKIAVLYICPYNKKNSGKAPEGFIIV